MKFHRLLFFVVALWLMVAPQLTHAADQERIRDFNVSLAILGDGSLQVVEVISYDFGTNQRHGIYRTIDRKSAGVSSRLLIDQIAVDDATGQAQPFQVSSSADNVRVKIGDPDRFVSGQKTYRIRYRVQGALGSFTDHDELYWNVTGNEWAIPIDAVRVAAALPTQIRSEDVRLACFTGYRDSTNVCDYQDTPSGSVDVVTWRQQNLNANQGLTIVLGWPKGVVSIAPVVYPEADDKPEPVPVLNILIAAAVPFVVLIIMMIWWLVKGRGPRGRGVIIPQYEPLPNLTPAETGVMFHGQMKGGCVTAEIIELARTGYLKITHSKKVIALAPDKDEFTLDRLKTEQGIASEYRRLLFLTLFAQDGWWEKNLPSLLNISSFTSFVSKLKKLKPSDLAALAVPAEGLKDRITLSEIDKSPIDRANFQALWSIPKEALIARNYFVSGSRFSLRTTMVIAVCISIGFMIVSALVVGNLWYLASYGMSCAIIVLFFMLDTGYTAKGVEARDYIRGLKLYLEVAEKERLKFHNAPEKNPQQFEALLPYAVALGVEQEWSDHFKDITVPTPSWYADTANAQFNSFALVQGLHMFSTSLSVSTQTGGSSGFGGGGSSGGGGGGGGGGSW